MYRIFFILVIAFFFLPFSAMARNFIHDIAIEEEAVNLAAGESASLVWKLAESCEMTVLIVDITGNIVRNLLQEKQYKEGEHTIEWDGRDNDGDFLPDGVYFAIVRGKSARKGIQVYNPTAEPWGVSVTAHSVKWKKKREEVQFAINKRALCRLRVYIKEGGPMYMPLTGWQFFLAGVHSIPWDGRDLQSVFQVTDQPNHKIGFDGFSLPKGTIFLSGSPTPPGSLEKERKRYPIHPPHGGDIAYITAKPNGIAPDPLITVEPNGDTTMLEQNVPVHIDLQPGLSPAQQLRESFELYLYVDGILDTEINGATLPQTLNWNTTKYSNGEHVLTVNILTTEDRVATYSLPVTIKNKK